MGAANKIVLFSDDYARMAEIKAFINKNFSQDLSIKFISERFTISRSTLRRHYYACYAVSVTYYIHQCRMNHAMSLIQNHSFPISQIAMEVGYNDRSAFTHAFTKFFGKSPFYILKNKQ